MKGITDRQKEVLTFISTYTEENTYPPTVRDISTHFGISLRAVQDHILALQKKGFLAPSQKKARSLRVISGGVDHASSPFVSKVPILGNIAAGKPLLSEENLDGYVNLTEPFVRPGKSYFALRVHGVSMINAGILDGDLAIIEQSPVAADGQIIVAVVDNAITLKRYYRESERIRLQPEKPDFQPIYSTDVRVVGVLSNIVRTY